MGIVLEIASEVANLKNVDAAYEAVDSIDLSNKLKYEGDRRIGRNCHETTHRPTVDSRSAKTYCRVTSTSKGEE
jgi:hypothetical protein